MLAQKKNQINNQRKLDFETVSHEATTRFGKNQRFEIFQRSPHSIANLKSTVRFESQGPDSQMQGTGSFRDNG